MARVRKNSDFQKVVLMTRKDASANEQHFAVAAENQQVSLSDQSMASEHKSFEPRIPRKVFGLRRVPPTMLKS